MRNLQVAQACRVVADIDGVGKDHVEDDKLLVWVLALPVEGGCHEANRRLPHPVLL